MAAAIDWTDTTRADLRRLRLDDRLPWGVIGEIMGVSRFAAVYEATRMGIAGALPRDLVFRYEAGLRVRPPLPAGHPASWGAACAGTVLAGTPYPMPVFL
jgi:hypothetical protein